MYSITWRSNDLPNNLPRVAFLVASFSHSAATELWHDVQNVNVGRMVPAAMTADVAAAIAGAPATAPREPAADDALRDLVASGDRDGALSILMRDHGAAVYTRAYRVLGDRDAAKDVLQQTFLEAYRDLARFDGRSSFKTWLLAIASHRALDAVRRVRRDEQRTVSGDLPALPDDSAADPPASVDLTRRLRALDDCLRQLSPEVRATVLMRFQQAMSYEQIAKASGDRPVTLHARVTRALPVLRRCLERKGMGMAP
jgi:RNA polymerase sigma-70 factor (ECF subfamily)